MDAGRLWKNEKKYKIESGETYGAGRSINSWSLLSFQWLLFIFSSVFFSFFLFFRGVTQLRASTIHYPDWRADEEPANFTTRNLFGGEFHLKQKKKWKVERFFPR